MWRMFPGRLSRKFHVALVRQGFGGVDHDLLQEGGLFCETVPDMPANFTWIRRPANWRNSYILQFGLRFVYPTQQVCVCGSG